MKTNVMKSVCRAGVRLGRMCRVWNRLAVVLVAAVSLGLAACSDDEGYSLGDVARDWATVERKGMDGIAFQADRWGLLWSAVPDPRLQVLNQGQRVIVSFNPLYDNFPGGYDCSVKVYDFRKVLTKSVELLTPANEAEYGNDCVVVPEEGIWLGSNCVNVVFAQAQPKEKPHRISLVRREGATVDKDGYFPLELRYHTHGDTTDRWLEVPVSFPLASLHLDEDESVKGVRVRVKVSEEQSKVWTLDFRPSGR